MKQPGVERPEQQTSRPPPHKPIAGGVTCAALGAHVVKMPPEVATTPALWEERANKWAVFALAAPGAFMTTLDSSIVNISLPSIARAFQVPLSGAVEWIIIGYLVVIAAVLLTAGRLADMIGRKPIFIAGIATFTLGSAISGAAPSLGILIAARCFQGLGGALLFAVNISMLTHAFPAKERGRILGLNSIMVALGVSAGPTLGGVITQYLTWRWIFYINVPIGIALVIAALFVLKEPLHRGQGQFDPTGAALLAVGLASLILGISFGQEWGWTSWRLFTSVIIGAAALVAATLVERRVKDPVISFHLLTDRVFASANISFILAMLALFAAGFLLPFYFEELRGFSTLQAGLLLTPLSLVLAVIAPISGALADRYGSRWLSPIGLAIACIGLFLLSRLDAQSSIWDIIWPLMVTGFGQGIFQAPNTRAIMGAAPLREQSIASGILGTGRVIGQSLSVALAGAIFATLGGAAAGNILQTQRTTLSPATVSALQATFITSFRVALLVCAGVAMLGVLTAAVRGNEMTAASAK
ncbi:MAG TPA: MFS transporter [Ktedonobacterales bacterium]|nr:MFS transporter [Ktedonobacterales bacterium]